MSTDSLATVRMKGQSDRTLRLQLPPDIAEDAAEQIEAYVKAERQAAVQAALSDNKSGSDGEDADEPFADFDPDKGEPATETELDAGGSSETDDDRPDEVFAGFDPDDDI